MMTKKEKQRVANAVCDFIDAVSVAMTTDEGEQIEIRDNFPNPTGLGTDGTLWTDEEHKAYLMAVAIHVSALLDK